MNVAVPDCSAPAPLWWREGAQPGSASQAHIDGSSIQLITWDKDNGTFTESFYLVGGANKGISGAPSECVGATVSSGVQRMMRVLSPINPLAWDDAAWESVASLSTPRVNHNTVILLDGSLLVVGGAACGPAGFSFPLSAERYMPNDVLDSPPATPTSQWILMASQEFARGYHSAAIMLPNGDVVSGGGKAEDNAYHSIEVYTPGWGKVSGLTRPAIDASTLRDPANNAYTYTGPPFSFDVTLAPGKTVNRVALIRNGSSTHAFNPDQRYVELARPQNPGDVQLSTSPNTWRLTVLAPLDGNWAPPGYYLLTVVDNAGVPSEAEWIRIAAEEGPAGP